MSVYRRPGRDTWSYDFWLANRRFSGDTGARDKPAARAFEKTVARPAAQRAVAAAAARESMRAGEKPLTVGAAAEMYWEERGQHQAGAADCRRDLDRMIAWFGAGRAMEEISDADVAQWVAKRRGETKPPRRGEKEGARIAPATVNRTTVGRLSALFGHARRKWKIVFARIPDFRAHVLPEPRPRPREIAAADRRALIESLPPGYADLAAFAQASGKRQGECLLTWPQIDEEARLIYVTQKGGETHAFPLTRAMAAILARQRGHHPTWVFTFVASGKGGARPGARGAKLIKGKRYPITLSGLRSVFGRRGRKLGLARAFHGQRHSRAMTLLRETGNLKAVQELLGHSDVSTTARYYAHVMADDLRAAIDRADAKDAAIAPAPRGASPTKNPTDRRSKRASA